jgi:hypothetical protein
VLASESGVVKKLLCREDLPVAAGLSLLAREAA